MTKSERIAVDFAMMQITELTRRSILDALLMHGNISGSMDVISFLKRVWPLDEMPSTDSRFKNAAADIWQHTVNNYDWDDQYLYLEYLELRAVPDTLFEQFVENVVHPLVRRDDDQQQIVGLLNRFLQADGRKLVQTDELSGHPIFTVQSTAGAVKPAAKNLIFAANGPKPEIVIADAVSNEIAITKNGEFCLIYDRPIPGSGLQWSDLVRWWGQAKGLPVGLEAERGLYARLFESLKDSPPEQVLFDTYFRKLRQKLGSVLPALIPQVYLHFDPLTKRQRRGARVLARERMDFLLLLPRGRRVVLEVDGVQHYSDGREASPRRYGEMVAEDRRLRLTGYEVFRFGGAELQGDSGRELVERFFLDLFAAHDLPATDGAGLL